MPTPSAAQSVKVAIVGMTGSGKTVLISTLAMKMAQMALQDIFMYPFGNEENRRQTLRYTNTNWKTLNEGQWPASTPAGELIQLQWELATKNQQAQVQFLDCAGQDIRSLFQTDSFNPSNLGSDLKRVYDNISSANVLIFLVNMQDLLATSDYVGELMDLDQMFHTLNQRNDIPRKMAVVFSQYDKYKPEVDQKFNGDFLEYLRHYIPLLHGQYIRKRNFEIIPVAAVNDTKSVIENGEVKQYPVPGFSSYNLETLIHWIADSVEELAPKLESFNQNSEFSPYQVLPLPPISHQDDPFLSARLQRTPPHPEQLFKKGKRYTPKSFTTPYFCMMLFYACAICFGLLFFLILTSLDSSQDTSSISPLFIISFFCFMGGHVCQILLLKRCWNVIQDGYAWKSTNMAVQILFLIFFLYIPFINLIWLIGCFYGLHKCLNNYIKRYQLDIQPSSSTAIVLTCITFNIPYLNFILPFFFLPFAVYSMMRTARDIQQLRMNANYNNTAKYQPVNAPLNDSQILPMPTISHLDDPFISARLRLAPPHPEQLVKHGNRYFLDDFTKPFFNMTLFYVFTICIGFFIVMLTSLASNPDYDKDVNYILAFFAFMGSILCLLGAQFYKIRLLYRCWNVIQDGYAWSTPDKAIQILYFPFLLFIPIINLIWLIGSFYGLHTCLNNYIKRYRLDIQPSSSTAIFLMCIAYNIPYLNLVLPIFFLPFAMYSLMRMARDIHKLKMQQIVNR